MIKDFSKFCGAWLKYYHLCTAQIADRSIDLMHFIVIENETPSIVGRGFKAFVADDNCQRPVLLRAK